jgi:hypothetical protein
MTTMESIEPLLERLLGGATLDADEREALAGSKDLLALGMAADELRRRRHGDRITFVRVATVPVGAAADARWGPGAGEVRLTGAPPDLSQAIAGVQAVQTRAGDLAVTGFSLADVVTAAGGEDAAARWCAELAGAGLTGLAEAPLDLLNRPEVAIRGALDAGLTIGALTLQRRPASLVSAFDLVSSLVEALPGLSVVAPLPGRVGGGSPTTGYEDVHLVALARLLTPVAHIQVDWQRYGPKLAQVALTFGADDVDGVAPVDEVAEGRRRAPLEEIRRNIRAAAAEPVERDARFRPR